MEEYPDFQEILKDYEPGPLPYPGEYAVLASRESKLFKPYVYDIKTVRTFHNHYGLTVVQCAEYGSEFIDYMASEMRYRRSQGFDNVCMVTGDERSGKSTFAQVLANRILGHDIELEKICFKLSDFNRAISEAPDEDVIIMDEAGVDLYSAEWWDEFQTLLVKKLFVIGCKHLTLLLVLPHQMDLNRKIRSRRVKYWFNVNARRGSLERGFCTVRESQTNEWVQEVFWETLGCCRFSQLKGERWNAYEEKKMRFVDEMNNEDYGSRSSKKTDRALMMYLLSTKGKMTQEQIAKDLNISQPVVSRMISNYREKLAKGKD